MKFKGYFALAAMMVLPGCQLMEETIHVKGPEPEQYLPENICLVDEPDSSIEHNCDLDYWLNYWVDADSMTWPKRRERIKDLSDDTEDQLRKIILSQSSDTPYQDRLRAQNWSQQLQPVLSDSIKPLLSVIMLKPNQSMLEFESALATLSKVNANQSRTIEEQQKLLEQKQQQLEKLLKIEASMMDNSKEKNQ